MRPDNKVMSFPGRSEGTLEGCFCFDHAIRKELAVGIEDAWPRKDESDPFNIARGVINADYNSHRYDHEAWLYRKSGTNDLENCAFDELYYINECREPEDPDRLAFTEIEPWESEDDDEE